MTWELLWKVVLVGTILAFAVMSAVVTVLGARDVKRLLRELREQPDDQDHTIT